MTNLIHTLDWRERKVRRAASADDELLREVLSRVIPLIGADRLFGEN